MRKQVLINRSNSPQITEPQKILYYKNYHKGETKTKKKEKQKMMDGDDPV